MRCLPLIVLIACATPTQQPGAADAGSEAADASPDRSPDAGLSATDARQTQEPPPDAAAGPDCSSYPYSAAQLLAERAGYGANAQGGDPGNLYHVTTLAGSGPGSLRAALESSERYWIVFDVEGTITHPSRVEVRSYKTIDGRGRDVTINGQLSLRDVRHIIINDVRLTNDQEGHCTQDGDVLSLRGEGGSSPSSYTTRDVWIHHVELFNGGDGLLDLRGASRVTVSWTHFHTHKKGLLMSRTMSEQPATGMRVTMHHNFFDRLSLRGPQFIYGRIHYFNNYQFHWYEYGAGGLGDAQFASERNIYEARPGQYCINPCPDPNPCGDSDFFVSKKALVHEWSTNGAGRVRSSGDLLLEGAEVSENDPGSVFDPASEYSYVAEPATAALAARIASDSGPRTEYCAP